MTVPQHAITPSQQKPDVTLPLLILNRSGYVDLHKRLVDQGLENVALAVGELLGQAQAIRRFGGYYLPFSTLASLKAFCQRRGITESTLRFLYRSNLLDYPAAGQPASITLDPGYPGRLRHVRRLPK